MTSPARAWLVSFDSDPADVPACQISWYRNEDINSYINSYMDTLEKAELTTSIRHIKRLLKSGILT